MKTVVGGMCLLAALLTGVVAQGAAQDEDQLATLKFLVVKDYNGKPIRNASVVLHPVAKSGKQERGGIELKCDADGKASYDAVPYGKLRIQVLTPGFQTFGEDYVVDKPEMEIVVKLKRPVGQYSIYTDHQNNKKEDAPPPATKDEKAASDKPAKDKSQ
jgi:hypothetical protein